MTKPLIAVCLPVADMIHPHTALSILQSPIPRPAITVLARNRQIEDARNSLVEDALRFEMPETGEKVTHLLWIDDDMIFRADAVDRLLVHDLPIVGGLCYNRHHPYNPVVMYKPPKGCEAVGYLYRYERDFPEPRGLLEVDATGAAFLLVKREVFEVIGKTFKPGEGPFSQLGLGEDVSFCDRARAAGYKIYIDTSIEIGHVSEVIVTEDFAKKNRTCLLNEWTPTIDVTKCGLRILGTEDTPDGIMHRARYRWAADVLAAMTYENKTIDRGMYRVLDFGCGTGHGVDYLGLRGFASYGYDLDETALNWGRKEFGLGKIISSDDAMLTVKYDSVTAFEVIEHLSDPPITTLRRLLSYAPIVLGSVPYMEPHGFNPHHVYSGLNPMNFNGVEADITFFGQKWDGTVIQFDPAIALDRKTTPIMLFVAKRRS